MIRRIAHDALGELMETGKSVGKQAGKQVSPKKVAQTAWEQVKGGSSSPAKGIPPGLEDLTAKQVPSAQLQQMKQKDVLERKEKLDQTRLGLKKIVLDRYRKMQQEIGQIEKQREQAKIEEKKREELMKKKKEEEKREKEQQSAQLPKGKPQKGRLEAVLSRKKGSRETKRGKLG